MLPTPSNYLYRKVEEPKQPKSRWTRFVEWWDDHADGIFMFFIFAVIIGTFAAVIIVSTDECPKCGRYVKDSANYCNNCGYMLRDMK